MPALFRHPRIHTGDPLRPTVTGLLVTDGVITATGDADHLAAVQTGTEVVDLPGELVLPGMHDAHIHTAALARSLVSVDLREARSLAEALHLVRAHLRTMPQGAWVFGGRWDSNKWDRPEQPTAADLDTVSDGHPIALSSIDGHTMWANSEALRLAGITADHRDPPGGEVVRDADGVPTGILREAAQEPIETLYESPASGDLASLLLLAQEELLSVGLTSVTDLNGEDARAAYLRLTADGDLKLRVTKGIPRDSLAAAIAEGRRSGFGDDWLRVGAVKLFSDGALGSRTAHMSRDFHGHPGNHGMPVMTTEQLYDAARTAVEAGIAVATHAIGDQANHLVLDVYERVRAETGTRLPLSIEHTQFLQRADVERLVRLGVTASMQPTHCTSDIDLVDSLLPDHDLVGYGWRTLLDAGAMLAFGSDAPVEEANPFFGLHAAVTRQRSDGTPAGGWEPGERITVDEAIAAYTSGSARLAGDFDRKGRLTPGRLADFIAVDTDITGDAVAAEPTRIRDTRVLQTVVGGRTRWSRE